MRRGLCLFPILSFSLGCVTATPAFADSLLLLGGSCGPSVTISSGAATIACPVTITGSNWIVTGSIDETGNLATGTFGVYATATNTTTDITGGALLSSGLEATYVFDEPGISSGTARFDIMANGSFSASGTSTLSGQLMEFEYYGGPWTINGVSQTTQTAHLSGGMSTIELDAPIVNGVVNLQYTLLANAIANGGGNSSGTVDFLDPVSITGASAFDANGNPVSATFVSESGFNPNAEVVPTPEPSSLALLGTGLLGVAAAVRRRLMV